MSDSKYLSTWMKQISDAAISFESRWTMKALHRVDPGMHQAMTEQLSLYHEAMLTGDHDDIETHGAATIRGYRAITQIMVDAQEPDDAYQIGHDPKTGTTVAIGDQKACVARVREVHGKTVIWLTPDECAALFASIEGFKAISAIKNVFPGAELVDRFPDLPAKSDSQLEIA